jgi:predicted transcriptional regulator
MPSAKERMTSWIQAQPDDAGYDEILRELALLRMMERGLEDVRAGRLVPHRVMERRVRSWGE